MKLALNSGGVYGYFLGKMGLKFYDHPEVMVPVLKFWKEKGYEGILLYDYYPAFYELPKEHVKLQKAVFDDVGMEVACLNLMRKTLFDPARAAVDEPRMYQALEMCEWLKPDIIDLTIDPPFPYAIGPQLYDRVYYRGDYAPFGDFAVSAMKLKKYAQACASIGAELSIEQKDDGLGDTADNLIKLVKMIDEPNVGVNPDVGNQFRAPYESTLNMKKEVEKLVPYTNYVEIKNYRRIWMSSEKRFIAWVTDVDLGDLDFRHLVVELWNHGYRGWVANEGGNGDVAQGTTGDKVAAELHFLKWWREVMDEWIPLMSKVEIPESE